MMPLPSILLLSRPLLTGAVFYGDTLLIILFQETGTELYVIFAWISVSGTGNKDKNHQYADGQNRFRSPASL
jgi:uncharacterized RDD family membrane protein YckC